MHDSVKAAMALIFINFFGQHLAYGSDCQWLVDAFFRSSPDYIQMEVTPRVVSIEQEGEVQVRKKGQNIFSIERTRPNVTRDLEVFNQRISTLVHENSRLRRKYFFKNFLIFKKAIKKIGQLQSPEYIDFFFRLRAEMAAIHFAGSDLNEALMDQAILEIMADKRIMNLVLRELKEKSNRQYNLIPRFSSWHEIELRINDIRNLLDNDDFADRETFLGKVVEKNGEILQLTVREGLFEYESAKAMFKNIGELGEQLIQIKREGLKRQRELEEELMKKEREMEQLRKALAEKLAMDRL